MQFFYDFEHKKIPFMKVKIIFLFFVSLTTFGQSLTTISGNITDSKTKQPIPFANVFFESTTIGTQTNIEGKFELKNVKNGNFTLVVSMVGYLSYTKDIVISDNNLEINVTLVEDIKALKEVKVISKSWESFYKTFEKDFLGNEFNKNEVTILNKEVIDFDYNDSSKIISAKSIEPIMIDNKTLGYKVYYLLDNFAKDKNKIFINGKVRFELKDPENAAQNKGFIKNRLDSYKGSLRHFLKSLIHNNLKEQGFEIEYILPDTTKPIYVKDVNIKKVVNLSEIISTVSQQSTLSEIHLKYPILIYYQSKYGLQKSRITQLSSIIVNKDGNLLNPYSIDVQYSMGDRRISQLLPLDYDYEIQDNRPKDLSGIPQFLSDIQSIKKETVTIEGIAPYYLAGETMNLTANVFEKDTKVLSEIITPLYIELIDNNKGIVIERNIVKIENGLGNFKIKLPDGLKSNMYQIRAYTNWMRNFSEDNFFIKNFTIFSKNYKQESKINKAITKIDTILVFSEGGHLIEGINNKVVGLVLDNFDKPLSEKVFLIDSKNDTLSTIYSDSLGICQFEIEPKQNQNYRIVCQNKSFLLAKSQKKTPIISLGNLLKKDFLPLIVRNNQQSISRDSLFLSVFQNGEIVFWKSFLNDRETIIFNLPKQYLTKKSECLLINAKGEVLSHRLIGYENSNDPSTILGSDKKALLITPFFKNSGLTNLNYSPERGLTFTGQILTKNRTKNKKSIMLSMVLSSVDADTLKGSKKTFFTEGTNNFKFENIDFIGEKVMTFIGNNNIIELDSMFETPKIKPRNLSPNWNLLIQKEELKKIDSIAINLPKQNNTVILEEVVVKSKKIEIDPYGSIPSEIITQKRIEAFNDGKNMLETLSKFTCFDLRPFDLRRIVKVFLDNILIRKEDFELIEPRSIENIFILKDASAGTYGCDCAILMKTKRGGAGGKKNEAYVVKGYQNE
jgi:CarboxypepD_reg-like domain